MIQTMTPQDAEKIIHWAYPSPYHLYNMDGSYEAMAGLLGSHYFSCFRGGALLGFFCYGLAARIPVKEGRPFYEAGDVTDIGLGLRPNLCGQGFGKAFMEEGMAYGRECLGYDRYRLTVADFNHRAIRLYTSLGFKEIGGFMRPSDNQAFIVMIGK